MRPVKQIKQKDIAEILGISTVSVSNALSGKKGVSEALREQVKQAAEQLGYISQEKQEKRATGGDNRSSGRKLSVICPAAIMNDDSFAAEKRKLAGVAFSRGFCPEFVCMEELFENDGKPCMAKAESYFMDLSPEGILFLGRTPQRSSGTFRQVFTKPMVGVSCFDAAFEMDYVIDDGFHGGECLTSHLKDAGSRLVYYIREEKDDELWTGIRGMREDRYLGYRCGVYAHNLFKGSASERDIENKTAFDYADRMPPVTPAQAFDIARDHCKDNANGYAGFFCEDVPAAIRFTDLLRKAEGIDFDRLLIGVYDADGDEPAGSPDLRKRIRAWRSKNTETLPLSTSYLYGWQVYHADTVHVYELAVDTILLLCANSGTAGVIHPVRGRIMQTDPA